MFYSVSTQDSRCFELSKIDENLEGGKGVGVEQASSKRLCS